MKKNLLITILVLLSIMSMEAQRRNGLIKRRIDVTGSLVLTFGPNYSFADPYSSKGFFCPIANQNFFANQDISIGYRHMFPNLISIRASLSYDHFTGDDNNSTTRNYSFSTDAFQLSAIGEYSYFMGSRFSRLKPHCIYGFLGLGVISSNAALIAPVSRSSYKYAQYDVTPTIPYGVGYRYEIGTTNLSLGAELNLRYTFSDLLDGFKPPYPESKSNDVFEGGSITLSYKLF